MPGLRTTRVIAAATLCFLGACAVTPDYKPHRHNVPLLSEKGQARLGVYGSRGVGAHLALSPFEHAGVTYQANLYDGGEAFSRTESDWMQQLGLGAFVSTPAGWLYETYLIGGLGRVSYDSSALLSGEGESLKARTWLAVLQPAVGYKHPAFEVAISGRTGYFGYSDVRGTSTVQGVDVHSYLRRHSRTWIFEPALTGRVFSKYAGFEAQIGRSVSVSRPALRQDAGWLSLSMLWRVPGVESPPKWRD